MAEQFPDNKENIEQWELSDSEKLMIWVLINDICTNIDPIWQKHKLIQDAQITKKVWQDTKVFSGMFHKKIDENISISVYEDIWWMHFTIYDSENQWFSIQKLNDKIYLIFGVLVVEWKANLWSYKWLVELDKNNNITFIDLKNNLKISDFLKKLKHMHELISKLK